MTKPPEDKATDFHSARGSKRMRQLNKNAQAKLTKQAKMNGNHRNTGSNPGASLLML